MDVKVVILCHARAVIRQREIAVIQRDIIILPHLCDFSSCLIASQSIICSLRAVKSSRHGPRDAHMDLILFNDPRIPLGWEHYYRAACRRGI